MAPSPTPGQQAWLNHIFGGQTDFRRIPSAPPPKTPAQRAGATRSANAARSRSAASPEYSPEEMRTGRESSHVPRARTQTGGRVRGPGPRFRVTNPPSPRASANFENVMLGKDVNATRVGLPKPPPSSVKIPSIPEGGINVTAAAESTGARAAKGIARGALRGIGGPIGGALIVADVAKQVGIETGMSKPYNTIIGPAESKAAEQYGAAAVLDQKRRNAGVAPGVAPAKPSPRPASPPRPSSDPNRLPDAPAPSTRPAAQRPKVSRLSDYGAAPKGGGGKFLRNAYMTNREYALNTARSGDLGALSTPESRKYATDKFKASHSWARSAKTVKQKRDLNAAITYLQNTRHSGYYVP